jgi:hypothetical protein
MSCKAFLFQRLKIHVSLSSQPIQLRAARNTKPDKHTQRLRNRLMLQRAQILFQQEWTDEAELAEAMVDDTWLIAPQKQQPRELHEHIAKRKARQRANQQTKR